MSTQLGHHTPLIACQVGYGQEKKILYWEGNMDGFNYIFNQGMSIRFDRHQGRVVHVSKIVEHWTVDIKALGIEEKLSVLSEQDKKTVKLWIKETRTKIGKEASLKSVDNMIKKLKGTHDQEQAENEKKLNDMERFKTKLIINNSKVAKMLTGKPRGFRNLPTYEKYIQQKNNVGTLR